MPRPVVRPSRRTPCYCLRQGSRQSVQTLPSARLCERSPLSTAEPTALPPRPSIVNQRPGCPVPECIPLRSWQCPGRMAQSARLALHSLKCALLSAAAQLRLPEDSRTTSIWLQNEGNFRPHLALPSRRSASAWH